MRPRFRWLRQLGADLVGLVEETEVIEELHADHGHAAAHQAGQAAQPRIAHLAQANTGDPRCPQKEANAKREKNNQVEKLADETAGEPQDQTSQNFDAKDQDYPDKAKAAVRLVIPHLEALPGRHLLDGLPEGLGGGGERRDLVDFLDLVDLLSLFNRQRLLLGRRLGWCGCKSRRRWRLGAGAAGFGWEMRKRLVQEGQASTPM